MRTRIDCFNIDAIFQMNGENFNWLKRPLLSVNFIQGIRRMEARSIYQKKRKIVQPHFLFNSLFVVLSLSLFIFSFIFHSLWADQHSFFYHCWCALNSVNSPWEFQRQFVCKMLNRCTSWMASIQSHCLLPLSPSKVCCFVFYSWCYLIWHTFLCLTTTIYIEPSSTRQRAQHQKDFPRASVYCILQSSKWSINSHFGWIFWTVAKR